MNEFTKALITETTSLTVCHVEENAVNLSAENPGIAVRR